MIVRAQIGIDDRLTGVAAHAIGADDVTRRHDVAAVVKVGRLHRGGDLGGDPPRVVQRFA